MPENLKWVGMIGGPLLLIPAELQGSWGGCDRSSGDSNETQFRCGGPDSEATDYDRACDVSVGLAGVEVADGSAIVLNPEPHTRGALVRLSSKKAVLVELPPTVDPEEVDSWQLPVEPCEPLDARLFLELKSGYVVLFEAVEPGDNIQEQANEVQLTPGWYRVATTDEMVSTTHTAAIHWLEWVGTEPPKPASAVVNATNPPAALQRESVAAVTEDAPLFPIDANGLWGFIDAQGSVVIPPQFKTASPFCHGLALVGMRGRFGFINKRGEMVIEPRFASAEDFADGLARVKVEGKDYFDGKPYFFINVQGEPAFELPFDICGAFQEGRAPVGRNKRWGCIDLDGNLVIDCQFDAITWYFESLAEASHGGRKLFLDLDGNTVFELRPGLQAHAFHEGLAGFGTRGKSRSTETGYLGRDGNIVIGPTDQWTHVGDFAQGRAPVLNAEQRYAYIDRSGRPITTAKFVEAQGFSEGLAAAATRSGAFGYIGLDGEFVLTPAFSVAQPFTNGLALVRRHGKWSYINQAGDVVWGPT